MNATDNGQVTQSFDLSPYISENLVIRFSGSGYFPYGITYFHLDNVQIAYGYPDPNYVAYTAANLLHDEGITGSGVGVAIIDTGYWSHPAVDKMPNGDDRYIVQYDAINDVLGPALDEHGHGSHIGSTILSSRVTQDGEFNGIAPGANLIAIKAFNANGGANYADVIRGIDWAVANKDVYNIRVINMSFSSPPQSFYWEDPLNQAVMRAWQAGIVVVAAAGNTGPSPMTIGVPGNTPYIITVGAYSDNQTNYDPYDDYVTQFSSAGPTVEGFVKPDVIAMGQKDLGLMPNNSTLAVTFPQWKVGNENYYTLSGTSQSTGLVTGIVALLLQQNPNLTPDQVKYRLMATANQDWPGYDATTAGAGYLDVYSAVYSNTTESANTGILPSQLLYTGHDPITWGSVGWNSVGWNSVGWNSVGWNSVGWNSVGWNSVGWNSDYWGQ
jgi:serine protease AprX